MFGPTPTLESLIPSFDGAQLLTHELNGILKKRVVGKTDVDIAAMIHRLQNSDWVKEGRAFYDLNNHVCPFCQQTTSKHFEVSLTEYFDETFVKDSNAIDTLVSAYKADAEALISKVALIIESPSKFLNLDKFKAAFAELHARIISNNQKLETKKRNQARRSY